MAGTGGPAAREMPIIHRIFRRQFAEVQALVHDVRGADATWVGAVADHLGFLLDGLHLHHTTEDDLIWPKLLDRVGLDAPLVERMGQQHRQIDESVAEVRAAMSAWRSDPTRTTSTVLADRLGDFLVVLEGHLDEEEQAVVPLIDRYLAEAEWKQVGERGFEKFTPAQRWIATGPLVEVATPEEVAMMLGALPPPVKVLWRLVGRRKYRRYIASVRGPAASAIAPDSPPVTALGAVLLGGAAGVAWSGALRLWMTQLVTEPRITSATVTLVLTPGAVVGGVLGHAWHRQSLGSTTSRWLVAAPLGLGVVAVVPSYAVRLATTGQGSGAIAVPLLGMAGGYAVSARGPMRERLLAGLLAGAGAIGMSVAPVAMNPELEAGDPRAVAAALLGGSLMLALIAACAVPHRGLTAPVEGRQLA